MPTPLEQQCFTILTAAASASVGIVVHTNNPFKARAALSRAKRELGDTEMVPLTIRVSPDDSEHELWVLKRDAMPMFNLGELL